MDSIEYISDVSKVLCGANRLRDPATGAPPLPIVMLGAGVDVVVEANGETYQSPTVTVFANGGIEGAESSGRRVRTGNGEGFGRFLEHLTYLTWAMSTALRLELTNRICVEHS